MPKLTHDGFRFVMLDSWSERETLKAAGWHFDFSKSVWWTAVIANARIFQQFADAKALNILGAEDRQIALSRALTSNLVIPCKEGLEYLPFQKACVEYCNPRTNVLIADPMGAGKSIEAVALINYEKDIKKVLVVCPASLRINWARELVKWLVRPMTGGFAYQKDFPTDCDIVIINYELLKRFRKEIDKQHWDLLIADEAHYVKSFTAARTQALLGTKDKEKPPIQAEKRVFMTGTPILNRPYELWPILSVADPDDLGVSEWGFIDRYLKLWEAPWANEYLPKKEMMNELQDRLRSRLMIRRTKSEILPQLPQKRRQIIALPPEAAQKTVQAEFDFFEKNTQLIESAVQKAEQTQSGDDVSFQEAADDLKRGRKALFTELAALRKATGLAKVPFIIEFVEQALEQEDKVVVFCHHREVIEKVYQHFQKHAVLMYGGMTDAAKQNSIDRFQEDKSCKLFVGGVSVAQGFTLTAGSLCIMSELDWRPAILLQAEDRLHRIGQKEAVLVQYLLFDRSLDSSMIKVILSKMEIIEKALG